MIRSISVAVLAFGLLLSGTAMAQEQAFANRATELKDRPALEARTIAPVADGTAVKVVSRQGGWTQVEVGTQKGWIRVFHLRFPSTVVQSSSGGGALSGLTSVFGFGVSKRGPETSKVATIGIRGLTPEDFQSSSPDAAALKKLQSYRSDKSSAERFAKEAKLAPVRVDYADAGKGS
jgi:hypothetical protein